MRYAVILILLVVLLSFVYYILRRGRNHSASKQITNHNVISIDRHRSTKNAAGEQPCSSCKKKNGKLIFYAQDNGTVVGLCKDCRVKAKNRDMLPL